MMDFYILTLFPEMVEQGLHTSIIGRALEKHLLELHTVNIRDYTTDKHGKVDDYPYGGGAGMLMQAQPVYDAWRAVSRQSGTAHPRTVYVTPQGRPFTQRMAEELAGEEQLVFLCGHYEGIDERVLEETVTDYVSIGDYVLTGGELPAMVMIDAVARLVPGVLSNETSAHMESFHNDLLEYPQYSRPELWHEKAVPQVLLSGDHQKIAAWRLEQSKERTRIRRPDLYGKYCQKEQIIQKLSRKKREYIHIMECLRRGCGEVLYAEGGNLLVYNFRGGSCSILAENEEMGRKLFAMLPKDTRSLIVVQPFLKELYCKEFGCEEHCACCQVCYTRKTRLKVSHKDIRRLDMEAQPYVAQHYHMGDTQYVTDRIQAGAMYGAFVEGRLAGFIGIHDDGSSGMLYVDEKYRRRGLGEALEAFLINVQLDQGYIPYGHVILGNEVSMRLQERLGQICSEGRLWWLGTGSCRKQAEDQL